MKTIKAAVASANNGDIVLVAPGIYRETAPIDITVNNLSIVGQSLRSCFVHPTPATELNSLFRVNSGTQIQNFSFGGLKACLLYTSPSPRDATLSRMPSSA